MPIKRKLSKKVNLRDWFHGLQDQMVTSLSSSRRNIFHPTAKGDVTEVKWLEMLSHYLPRRYRASRAFVLDSNGHVSDQIDIVVYDRQYSPYLVNVDGALHVPAESVYAVFEVKQELGAKEYNQACDKAESVRSLERTSVHIKHAGGRHDPVKPFDIIAGILALRSSWSPPFGHRFERLAIAKPLLRGLDIGCALQDGAFDIITDNTGERIIEFSKPKESLVFMFLHLLSKLQNLGTVPAIDFSVYSKTISAKRKILSVSHSSISPKKVHRAV